MSKVAEPFVDTLAMICRADRLRIEEVSAIAAAIRTINCDALEARDLIGVLIDTLKYKFKEEMLTDVNQECRQLVQALEELQYEASLNEPEDCLDSYKDSRAREAGL